jgi:hypothetical protein
MHAYVPKQAIICYVLSQCHVSTPIDLFLSTSYCSVMHGLSFDKHREVNKLIGSLKCWVPVYLACLMSSFHHADVTTFLLPQQSCMCLSSWCHQYIVILHVSVSNIAYPFFHLYLYVLICHLLCLKNHFCRTFQSIVITYIYPSNLI